MAIEGPNFTDKTQQEMDERIPKWKKLLIPLTQRELTPARQFSAEVNSRWHF